MRVTVNSSFATANPEFNTDGSLSAMIGKTGTVTARLGGFVIVRMDEDDELFPFEVSEVTEIEQ
jgi:hypothetical protein